MKKIALVVYNGDVLCFNHVMLYAFDFKEKGYAVKIVLEGAATTVPGQLDGSDSPFAELYGRFRQQGFIDCVCQACAMKMGAYDEVKKQGLPLNGEMSGHPSLEKYISEGYTLLTF